MSILDNPVKLPIIVDKNKININDQERILEIIDEQSPRINHDDSLRDEHFEKCN